MKKIIIGIILLALSIPAQGQTVAAALLSEGHLFFRNSEISGQPRAPYCMMGVCYECMLEIDGQSSQQSCLIPVREGMKIRRQNSLKG